MRDSFLEHAQQFISSNSLATELQPDDSNEVDDTAVQAGAIVVFP